VRASEARLIVAGFARRIGRNRSGSELAHAARRGDGGHTIELGARATGGRSNLAERDVQQACRRNGSYAVGCHDGDDFSLARAQVRH
jgi:hypothetical protein